MTQILLMYLMQIALLYYTRHLLSVKETLIYSLQRRQARSSEHWGRFSHFIFPSSSGKMKWENRPRF